jgi:hypothetical protein
MSTTTTATPRLLDPAYKLRLITPTWFAIVETAREQCTAGYLSLKEGVWEASPPNLAGLLPAYFAPPKPRPAQTSSLFLKKAKRDSDGDAVCPHCSLYNYSVALGPTTCTYHFCRERFTIV